MRLLAFTALLSLAGQLSAAEVLPLHDRTNGASTDAALEPLRPWFTQSVVRVLNSAGKHVLTGTWVSADGYFLTKASEAPTGASVRVMLPDGSTAEARVVYRALDRDLLLAKVQVTQKAVAQWVDYHLADLGDWVLGSTAGVDEQGEYARVIRVGVISAARRSIPASKAALGLVISNTGPGGVAEVSSVWPDSPAAGAGVLEGDKLLAVEGQSMTSAEQLRDALAGYRAGQEVKLTLQRGKTNSTLSIRLGSYSRVHLTAAGEDYANGGVSLRTDGYAAVLQHDLPLKPRDMGSPLLDLNGNCIGLNIARVDRVTTFALPADSFVKDVELWISQDQRSHAETIRKALPVEN
jgi:serine protease Do